MTTRVVDESVREAAARQIARAVAGGLSPVVTDEAVLRRVASIIVAARARGAKRLEAAS